MVLVDTSVWADFLNGFGSQEALALKQLIEDEVEKEESRCAKASIASSHN